MQAKPERKRDHAHGENDEGLPQATGRSGGSGWRNSPATGFLSHGTTNPDLIRDFENLSNRCRTVQ
jgi:hypothetical protein